MKKGNAPVGKRLSSANAKTQTSLIRNRIKGHITIRAGDLVPHELNPRVHSDEQREALKGLFSEIGFARSLLAYELPDGRYKLIDGHLRRSMDPNEEVTVEVLDVNDEEARKLLLSIDPLAQIADYDNKKLDQLRQVVETDNDTLNALWHSLKANDRKIDREIKKAEKETAAPKLKEQHIVIVDCDDEDHQKQVYEQLKREGLKCKLLTS